MTRWWSFLLCLVVLVGAPTCKEQPEPQQAPEGPAPAGSASATASGRCEHGLPRALCTKCNPSLVPVFKAKGDWCEEHGFPESFCPICKPGAAVPDVGTAPAPATDWCVEHALPESKCTKCNPSLIADFKAKGDWCGEHGFPESVCPICNPQTPPAGAAQAAIEARVVRFRSKDIEQAAGIQTVAAEQSQATLGLDCPVHVVFDSDRVADVRAIVPGIVRTVRVELGAQVKQGAPLFHLESTRVGEVQGALEGARERVKSAEQNLARQRKLLESEVTSVRQVEVAEQELASAQTEARTAEATLRMAGAAQAAPSGRYTLTAPIAGTIVRRPAVVGVLATESESLATIADTSVMWAMCDLSEREASRVLLGQKVSVTTDGDDSHPIEGEITWIAAEVDPRTRTVTARAELKNPDGRLRQNQFGRARIQAGAAQTRVTVPRSAVQRVGEHEVVFVRTRPGLYEPRVVERHGGTERVQVEGRVLAGDKVVTTGAVLLRTEIMPGSIGAGCCELEPRGDD